MQKTECVHCQNGADRTAIRFFFHMIAGIVLLASTRPLSALPFNNTLLPEERTQLTSGAVVIRNIGTMTNVSLNSTNGGAQKIKKSMSRLAPTYLAEVIQIRPYAGNEDLPERLGALLMNISDYAGIPYFSERHERYYDLYETAKIISQETVNDTTERVVAELTMEPFGTITTPIEFEKNSDYLLYTSTNANKLRYYDKFTCINKEKMQSMIVLFRDEDNWILYGIGGVHALRLPGLTTRIETSFINRIKTFCSAIFGKL